MTEKSIDSAADDRQDTTDLEQERPKGPDNSGSISAFTRRGVLLTGGLLGLMGLGTNTASAAGDSPSGQIGTDSNPLNELYTANLYGSDGSVTLGADLDVGGNKLTNTASINGGVTGNSEITDLVGSGLTINSGSLEASGGGSSSELKTDSGNTAMEVQDGTSGANVIGGTNQNTKNFPSQATISGGAFNEVGADGATIGGGGVNKATSDDATVAGGEENIASGNKSSIGGGSKNKATASNTAIGGGTSNEATKADATVAGGRANKADGKQSAIGGGESNKTSAEYSTIAGGRNNETTSGLYTTVAGGADNTAGGDYSSITGGNGNTANGENSVVVGGKNNVAAGDNSFAAGRLAKTKNKAGRKEGAFVWGDSSSTVARAQNPDEVRFQATGGFVIDRSDAKPQAVRLVGGLPSGNGDSVVIDDTGFLRKSTGGSSTSKLVTSGSTVTAMEVLDGSSSVSASSDGATPPNILGGHPSNNTGGSTVKGVTISGGGGDSGGDSDSSNKASADFATIGGGNTNEASADFATIGGGKFHTASGTNATIAGGLFNKATTNDATVGGGTTNEASGQYATIPGGRNNIADGSDSFAAGRDAETNGKNGAFVWGDSSKTAVTASAANEVVFQASGGMRVGSASDMSTGVELSSGGGSWSSLSSKTAKSDIEPVNGPDILEAVDSLDIATWRYDTEDEDIRHMGPMAEDFYDVFSLGDDERRITNVDADGVALAAIKGLSEKLDEKDDRIHDLEAENEALRERVTAIESELGTDTTGEEVSADD